MVDPRRWLTRRSLIAAMVAVLVLAVGWRFSAYPRGMIAGWGAGLRGHNEIKVFGLPPPWYGEYTQLIRERYGVEINTVGDVVTRDSVWYADGYNSVARQRIRARFGKDIFAECAQEARTTWELAHPSE